MTEEREKNAIIPGTLYLVATPIGNLADISERALKVLSGVDFIAAEDTRNTGLMLSRLGISKPMVSYFEHNKTARGLMIAERLRNMESCALVTDAGTPASSDPGEDIARLCQDWLPEDLFSRAFSLRRDGKERKSWTISHLKSAP